MRKLFWSIITVVTLSFVAKPIFANAFGSIPNFDPYQNQMGQPLIINSSLIGSGNAGSSDPVSDRTIVVDPEQNLFSGNKRNYHYKVVWGNPTLTTKLILDDAEAEELKRLVREHKIVGTLIYEDGRRENENECQLLGGAAFKTLSCDLNGLENATDFQIHLKNIGTRPRPVEAVSPILTVQELDGFVGDGEGDIVVEDVPSFDPGVEPPSDPDKGIVKLYVEPYSETNPDDNANPESNVGGGGSSDCAMSLYKTKGSLTGPLVLLTVFFLLLVRFKIFQKRSLWMIAAVAALFVSQNAFADRCGYLMDRCRFPNETNCVTAGVDAGQSWSEIKQTVSRYCPMRVFIEYRNLYEESNGQPNEEVNNQSNEIASTCAAELYLEYDSDLNACICMDGYDRYVDANGHEGCQSRSGDLCALVDCGPGTTCDPVDGQCKAADGSENPEVPNDQSDYDGVPDDVDNCPGTANPVDPETGVQLDTDGDGLGDECDQCPEAKAMSASYGSQAVDGTGTEPPPAGCPVNASESGSDPTSGGGESACSLIPHNKPGFGLVIVLTLLVFFWGLRKKENHGS